MEKVKFRAWSTELKYMFKVASIEFDAQIVKERRGLTPSGDPLYRKHLFREIVLEMYTEKKDIHGKELYEGDICEKNGWKGIIIWDNSHFWFEEINSSGITPLSDQICTYQKIGNVHENRVLMEDKL